MAQQTQLETNAPWESVFDGGSLAALESLMPDYLRERRWFSAKARTIAGVKIADAIPFKGSEFDKSYFALLEVQYAEGDTQTFVLPLAFVQGDAATEMQETTPQAVVASLRVGDQEGVLYDASYGAEFARNLLDAIGEQREAQSGSSTIRFTATPVHHQIVNSTDDPMTPRIVGVEQSNTSIIYGQQLILKLFRRLEQGTSPDLEVGRFLTTKNFANTPPLAGAIELQQDEGDSKTLAIMQGFAPNKGDAWGYTLEELAAFLDRAATQTGAPIMPDGENTASFTASKIPAEVDEIIGPYLAAAQLLGRRTAEMHLALASDPETPAFAPEPLTLEYQKSLIDSVQSLMDNAFPQIYQRLADMNPGTRTQAEKVLGGREVIKAQLQPLRDRAIDAQRTRVHGDYHMGQVLYNGEDFMIIDFEGEPLRPLAERRAKHSPLKDVAGMLRSFHYAAYAALFSHNGDRQRLEPWANAWNRWISLAFMSEYLQVAREGAFLPQSETDLQILLDAYLLEKAIYELIYELNNRPDWLQIPLQGVAELVR